MRGLTTLLLLLICCSHTYAWGDKGHQVIALIAWHYLSPATRHQIDTLLKNDDSNLTATDFVSESTWADRYRDSDRATTQHHYEQTRRWHYINLAVGNLKNDNSDFSRACFGSPPLEPRQNASEGQAKACVTDKIEQFIAELKSPTIEPAERLLALQFLIHLIGDLHQPLHVGDNDDSGGNKIFVSTEISTGVTLHSYWDNDVVALLGREPSAIAHLLIAQTDTSDVERLQRGSPRDWTFETLAIARDAVYGKLPPPNPTGIHPLDRNYASAAKLMTTQQLIKAGVRLAGILEQAFSRRNPTLLP